MRDCFILQLKVKNGTSGLPGPHEWGRTIPCLAARAAAKWRPVSYLALGISLVLPEDPTFGQAWVVSTL